MLLGVTPPSLDDTSHGRAFWYVPHGPVLDYDDPKAAERLRKVEEQAKELMTSLKSKAVVAQANKEASSAQ